MVLSGLVYKLFGFVCFPNSCLSPGFFVSVEFVGSFPARRTTTSVHLVVWVIALGLCFLREFFL